MLENDNKTNDNDNRDDPIDFAERFASSALFDKVFSEGMGLVEETANYLDGPGRKDARQLDRQGSLNYATESMRLTTRLMQLASWLLLQRAVKLGEMTQTQTRDEKYRVKLDDVSDQGPAEIQHTIPEPLKDLIDRSLRIHERIARIDQQLVSDGHRVSPTVNPVTAHLDRLKSAYPGDN